MQEGKLIVILNTIQLAAYTDMLCPLPDNEYTFPNLFDHIELISILCRAYNQNTLQDSLFF